MPNRRSTTSAWSISSTSPNTVTTCPRSPSGAGARSGQRRKSRPPRATTSDDIRSRSVNVSMNLLRRQYSIGSIRFTGTQDALYERHLIFDRVLYPVNARPHDQWEAAAHALRDIISQRWLRTDDTYLAQNPKRIYYLSMEYLLGRALENNLINAMLTPLAREGLRRTGVDWEALTNAEPDAGLGNGGLGRLAACFLDSMASLQLPGMGYGLRYEYGMFRQTFENGWQQARPDNWLRWPDPWEVPRPEEAVEVRLNCSFELQSGELRPVFGRP